MPMCLAIKRANPNIIYRGGFDNLCIRIRKISLSTSQLLKMPFGICLIYLQEVVINITPAIPPIHMKTSILIDSDAIISESKTKQVFK